GKGTLLVVDDEDSVRNVARTMLERAGFKVLTANDGRQGVEVFREHATEIAAVILDLTMPCMNGDEAFRELRQIQPNVRVILASGYAEQDTSQQFAGKGFAVLFQTTFAVR